ncbi:hypothetical protein KIPB_005419, partial [Kipferlia bialata]|eukprot:g5419.t1
MAGVGNIQPLRSEDGTVTISVKSLARSMHTPSGSCTCAQAGVGTDK